MEECAEKTWEKRGNNCLMSFILKYSRGGGMDFPAALLPAVAALLGGQPGVQVAVVAVQTEGEVRGWNTPVPLGSR